MDEEEKTDTQSSDDTESQSSDDTESESAQMAAITDPSCKIVCMIILIVHTFWVKAKHHQMESGRMFTPAMGRQESRMSTRGVYFI